MRIIDLEPFSEPGLRLGECPRWNPVDDSLSYVDILTGTLYVHKLKNPGQFPRAYRLDDCIGAALPVGRCKYLVLLSDGIYLFEPERRMDILTKYPITNPNLRPNDARIGPDGALWYGLMDAEEAPEAGSLWRFDGKKHQLLLDKLTIPNGLDWSRSGFYFVNGPASEISVFLPETKQLKPQSRIRIGKGVPDGLEVDNSESVWAAIWGEGKVVMFSEQSPFAEYRVRLGSSLTSAVAIAGGSNPKIYVTAACENCHTEVVNKHSDHTGQVFQAEVMATPKLPFSPRESLVQDL